MSDETNLLSRHQRRSRAMKVAKYGIEFADVDMRGRHGNHAKGAQNARYRGGRMKSTEGYELVKVPDDHHLRQAHGYAYEHQLVAEEMLGRRLLPDEVVHHINHIRTDNRPENLRVTTVSEHAREHAQERGRDGLGRFPPKKSGGGTAV